MKAYTPQTFEHLIGPPARPITHVSLFPTRPSAIQPEAVGTIVLWHISPAAAAALK